MKKIQLSGWKKPRKYAIIDDADEDLLSPFKWWADIYGYVIYKKDGCKTISMHRLIMQPAPGYVVDHINGDTLDNRRSNLRICSRAKNSQNRAMNSNNASGYKGVTFHKKTGRWQANIGLQYKLIYLGLFDSAKLASDAYEAAAREHFGEFVRVE